MHITYCCCRRRDMTVITQSVAVHFQRRTFVEAIDTEMVEEGFHYSSAPAFAEFVWSKHRTNLDL